MTQPVQEPSQGRTTQGLEFRTRQLFRRPVPPTNYLLRYWGSAYGHDDAQTINDSTDTQISFDTAVSPGSLVEPVGFDTTTARIFKSSDAQAFIFRMQVYWESGSFYRAIWMDFSSSTSGITLGGYDFSTGTTKDIVKPYSETSKFRFQELTAVVTPYLFTDTDYCDVTFYARQESGSGKAVETQVDVIAPQADISGNLVNPGI